MSFEQELASVTRWCDAADALALEHFRPGLAFELKADGSQVTVADRGIESLLRTAIAGEFGGDAILGEEEGSSGDGPRRWIIDPIDATTNFVRGIPIFATLIALEDADGLALGFVSAPAMRERWWATRGGGAFRNGDPIRVSDVAALEDAHLSTGGLDLFDETRLAKVMTLIREAPRSRGFGDFHGHMLVAQGSMEAMIDPIAKAWDLAACSIIVSEAGGRMTTLDGEPRFDGGSGLSTNGIVHDAFVRSLSP